MSKPFSDLFRLQALPHRLHLFVVFCRLFPSALLYPSPASQQASPAWLRPFLLFSLPALPVFSSFQLPSSLSSPRTKLPLLSHPHPAHQKESQKSFSFYVLSLLPRFPLFSSSLPFSAAASPFLPVPPFFRQYPRYQPDPRSTNFLP